MNFSSFYFAVFCQYETSVIGCIGFKYTSISWIKVPQMISLWSDCSVISLLMFNAQKYPMIRTAWNRVVSTSSTPWSNRVEIYIDQMEWLDGALFTQKALTCAFEIKSSFGLYDVACDLTWHSYTNLFTNKFVTVLLTDLIWKLSQKIQFSSCFNDLFWSFMSRLYSTIYYSRTFRLSVVRWDDVSIRLFAVTAGVPADMWNLLHARLPEKIFFNSTFTSLKRLPKLSFHYNEIDSNFQYFGFKLSTLSNDRLDQNFVSPPRPLLFQSADVERYGSADIV